jgi:hypothetical protein
MRLTSANYPYPLLLFKEMQNNDKSTQNFYSLTIPLSSFIKIPTNDNA